jgi:hypothetical protein
VLLLSSAFWRSHGRIQVLLLEVCGRQIVQGEFRRLVELVDRAFLKTATASSYLSMLTRMEPLMVVGLASEPGCSASSLGAYSMALSMFSRALSFFPDLSRQGHRRNKLGIGRFGGHRLAKLISAPGGRLPGSFPWRWTHGSREVTLMLKWAAHPVTTVSDAITTTHRAKRRVMSCTSLTCGRSMQARLRARLAVFIQGPADDVPASPSPTPSPREGV